MPARQPGRTAGADARSRNSISTSARSTSSRGCWRATPRIVGLGVYIWNVGPSTEVVELLKQLAPEVRVVLGGPEVSHEADRQEIVALADHVITGEADLAFAALCRRLLAGERPPKLIAAPPPDLTGAGFAIRRLHATRTSRTGSSMSRPPGVVRFRASSACPRSTKPVRAFPLAAFLAAMEKLLDRGVRTFKFLDRTFNLNLAGERGDPGIFPRPLAAGDVPAFRDGAGPVSGSAARVDRAVSRRARCSSRWASRRLTRPRRRNDQPPAGLRADGGQLPVSAASRPASMCTPT